MGNKGSTQLLPSVDTMLKAFGPEEMLALEDRFPVSPSSATRHHQETHRNLYIGRKKDNSSQASVRFAPVLITREEFVALLGEGFGPCMKRLLRRLFTVLDANGTGALEYQEHVGAMYFFKHASPVERFRVIFHMYEPKCSSASTTAAASKVYLDKDHVMALCTEIFSTLSEVDAGPQRVMASFQRDNDDVSWDFAPPLASSEGVVPTPVYLQSQAAPFKDVIGVMVDMIFLRWDADRDGRLNLLDFEAFASHHPENGIEDVLGKLVTSPHVARLMYARKVQGKYVNGKG
ncbi:hypothetical protein NSK_003104 [Nannochloropsis salina CCMP1776]|uniref:EF-hand domain-containing protein n=1 Tax=Nannochloropsis salina CCMP1776 TaxID=1027361 RepID=A0A4D9D805_9STRA|nr:hypothetical protein NSK_003104 [Nannochloropsis salina CCMP1776]|eukprot:TFJ85595.1 hypothetical protein NSK_003104 [Nannochloropsis salina CCMP1776]